MRVLVACEHSGTVRDAFLRKGHFAISCDLLPNSTGPHYQGDVCEIIDNNWDLMIAHPDCTYLCSSGLHHNKYVVGRKALTDKAIGFVRYLMNCGIPKIAIENPVGCISTRIRAYDQLIQPYEFGHDASKGTCLWLTGLPLLVPTSYIKPRIVNGLPRWANQTDSGQNAEGPSEDRWKIRAKTYEGVANAMADQWTNLSFMSSFA